MKVIYGKVVAVYDCGKNIGEHENCIYCYVNKINGKRYVGQAKKLKRRHLEHTKKVNNRYPIDKALKKYGLDNFILIVLKEQIKTLCTLNLYECYYIKKFNTLVKNKKGYNLANGGHNGNTWAGKTQEEFNEFKQVISKLNKGRERPQHTIESQRIKITGKGNGFYGKTHTEETKKKISVMASKRVGELNPFYGKTHTKETKKKISEAKKGRFAGELNPFYGKVHTEETKQKIRETQIGKKVAQFDKEGNLIKVWDYAKLASEQLNIDQSTIGRVCKGKGKTAGGYIWKYVDES